MKNFQEIVTQYIKNNAYLMLKEKSGVFNYPFIVPGAGYESDLWDWDSYWSAYALRDITEYFKDDSTFKYSEKKEKVIQHTKGIILNLLDKQELDGFIPNVITSEGLFSTYLFDLHRQGKSVNQAKPFLCQLALSVSEQIKEYEWFDLSKLLKYITYYDNNLFDKKTGLYFWQNDVMIGIDNNPTVFGRPECSTADIFLNSFMYMEIIALSKLLKKMKNIFWHEVNKKAKILKQNINKYMYDNKTGFYYSVDLLVKDNSNSVFHLGMKPFWNVLPIKIRLWAGFLPMMAGISDKKQNMKLIENYLDPSFNCKYGIRTLPCDEPMYNTNSTSNPSNWLGPVWIIANYCVFKGLLNIGKVELAKELKDKTMLVLGKDIEKNGKMSESYVPETGKPMLWNGFLNWNCLAISMLQDLKNINKEK